MKFFKLDPIIGSKDMLVNVKLYFRKKISSKPPLMSNPQATKINFLPNL